mgnify:CR=1 FL=1
MTSERRAYLSAYWQRVRAARVAAGLCGRCGRPAEDGYRSCRPHRDLRQRLSNPNYHREYRRRRPDVHDLARLKWWVGLDKVAAQNVLQRQHGLCEACGQPESMPSRKRLSIDHDHASGQFRGVLCAACNSILGLARDDPRMLRCLADYIEERINASRLGKAV